jgi:hypothetical protein
MDGGGGTSKNVDVPSSVFGRSSLVKSASQSARGFAFANDDSLRTFLGMSFD